jgi:hypothetical protein
LTEERTRTIQRLEKVLQDAGIKLTSVASTILGKTGRAVLAALLAGQEDPAALAELAKGRLRPKIPALREALTHRFRIEHHGLLVGQMLAHVDFLERDRRACDDHPRVGRRVAEVLRLEEEHRRVARCPRSAARAIAPPARHTKSPACALTTSRPPVVPSLAACAVAADICIPCLSE